MTRQSRQCCQWPAPARATCANPARSTVVRYINGRWGGTVYSQRAVCGTHEAKALRRGWKLHHD